MQPSLLIVQRGGSFNSCHQTPCPPLERVLLLISPIPSIHPFIVPPSNSQYSPCHAKRSIFVCLFPRKYKKAVGYPENPHICSFGKDRYCSFRNQLRTSPITENKKPFKRALQVFEERSRHLFESVMFQEVGRMLTSHALSECATSLSVSASKTNSCDIFDSLIGTELICPAEDNFVITTIPSNHEEINWRVMVKIGSHALLETFENLRSCRALGPVNWLDCYSP